MAELVDAPDSKSGSLKRVWVRFPLRAPDLTCGIPLNFCSHCGSPVTSKIPDGDDLPRFVCANCGAIHYKNPLLVLGCVPEWQNKILLCRRAIEPRLGFWTVPAGFMENGETMEAVGCARVLRGGPREGPDWIAPGGGQRHPRGSGARDVPGAPFWRGIRAGPGKPSRSDCTGNRGSWDDLAFPSGEFTLRRYFADRAKGREDYHFTELTRPLKSSWVWQNSGRNEIHLTHLNHLRRASHGVRGH